MALTYTERANMPMGEGHRLVAWEIGGDNSTTTVPAVKLKLQYVKFAFVVNINESTPLVLTTNYGTTLTYGGAFESSKSVLLVAVGY